MYIYVSMLFLTAHIDDVRALVMRAIKDLSIEQSLKTYEEVWLGKIFDLENYIRNKMSGKLAGHEHDSSQKEGVVFNVSIRNFKKCFPAFTCIMT